SVSREWWSVLISCELSDRATFPPAPLRASRGRGRCAGSLCLAARTGIGRPPTSSERRCARTRDTLPIRLPALAGRNRVGFAQVHSASYQVRDDQGTDAQVHAPK